MNNYRNGKIICNLEKSATPIESKVATDEFTDMLNLHFDFNFDGVNKVYPYILPEIVNTLDYNILCITGPSGSGKSTLIKQLAFNSKLKEYDSSKAIISNFESYKDAENRLCSVGLASVPTWCKPRNVLSVGEGARADLALNINNNVVFDEFTSTIDRNTAIAMSNSIQKYIYKNDIKHVVFVSAHNDYIDFIKPSLVIDLETECLYDCRNINLSLDKSTTYHYNNEIGTFTI